MSNVSNKPNRHLSPKAAVALAIFALALSGALGARWYLQHSSLFHKAAEYVRASPELTEHIGNVVNVRLAWRGKMKFDWVEHGLKARMWLVAKNSEGGEYRVYFYGEEASNGRLKVHRMYVVVNGKDVMLE